MCLAHRALDRRTVTGIQEQVTEKCGRSRLSRLLHAKDDKDTIATWKLDLGGILHVFNVSFIVPVRPLLLTVHLQTELAMNTHTVVLDIHRNVLKSQEGTDDQHQSVSDFVLRSTRPPPN